MTAEETREGNWFRDFLLHLRLPFQLVLSPIFLWGALFGGDATGRMAEGLLLGFLVFHVALCPGATVINSYYDRDEGPVAWLRKPPPVRLSHLWASFALQAVGFVLALRISTAFAVVYLSLVAVGVVYSHPRIRVKSRLWPSLVLVTLGHGGGAFLSGFLASGGSGETDLNLWALSAALLLPTGLFPLTQVYQLDEDRERGDETLAVRYGWRAAFRFSEWGLALGTVLASIALYQRFGPIDAVILALGTVGTFGWMRAWRSRFESQDEITNHDEMARITASTSLAFGLLILARLFLWPTPVHAAVSAEGVLHGVWHPVGYLPLSRSLEAEVQTSDVGGGAFELRGWMRVNDADREAIWAVLTEFEKTHEIFPTVQSSELAAVRDSSVLVHHEGKATFILSKTIRMEMEYRPKPPWEVQFQQRRGDLGEFVGKWAIAPMGGDSLLLSFEARLDAELGIPNFLLRPVLGTEVEKLLPAVAERASRRRSDRWFEPFRAGIEGTD